MAHRDIRNPSECEILICLLSPERFDILTCGFRQKLDTLFGYLPSIKQIRRERRERRELTPLEGHFAEKNDFTPFLITFERRNIF